MFWKRSLSVSLVVMLAVSMGGCFGLFRPSSTQGSINGRVCTADGTGLAAATVSVAGTPLTTQTDEEGHFSIANVPSGKQTLHVSLSSYGSGQVAPSGYYVTTDAQGQVALSKGGESLPLVETLNGFAGVSALNEPAEQSTKVSVEVPRKGSVNTVVTLNGVSSMENLLPYSLNPKPGTQLVNETKYTFEVGTHYQLNTNGYLYLLLSCEYSGQATQTIGSNSVFLRADSNKSIISATGTLSLLATAVTPILLLADKNGSLLTYSMLPTYTTNYNPEISYHAITIFLAAIDGQGVHLKWNRPESSEFHSYLLRRGYDNLAVITDPDITSYTDPYPIEGIATNYTVSYYQDAYNHFSSNALTVTAPAIGITTTPLNNVWHSVISDPQGRYFYASSPDTNQLFRISAATGRIDKTLDTCPGPKHIHMSPGGDTLTVTCTNGDAVALIDLNTFTISQIIRDIYNVKQAILDEANQLLYIYHNKSALDTQTNVLTVYNLATHTATTHTLAYAVANMAISPDGSLIYLATDYYKIRILQTSDMSLLHELNVASSCDIFFINNSGDKLYVDRNIYNARSPWEKLHTMDAPILSIDASGQQMLIRKRIAYANHIEVYEQVDSAWHLACTVYIGQKIENLLMTTMGDTLLFYNAPLGNAAFTVADLTARKLN